MGKHYEIDANEPNQIHSTRSSEDEEYEIKDGGKIDKDKLKSYNGLTVKEVEDKSYESFDSDDKLVETNVGKIFLIVHRDALI